MSKYFYQGKGKVNRWPDINGVYPMSITYDDVLIVPRVNTTLSSRQEADTSCIIGPFKLDIPIICAPMDTISSEKVIRKLHYCGALGILPRGDLEENLDICERLVSDNVQAVFAIGLKEAVNTAKKFKERGARMILLDTAHGGMQKVIETAVRIKEEVDIEIMVGNVATYDAVESYKKYGIEYIRVGIGSGSVCTTRMVAGVGIPQLSAIFDTSEVDGVKIIADGGVKNPGDFAKALAAGAKYVMMGSPFAECIEKPKGNIYRGQASASYMQDNGNAINKFRAPEGCELEIKPQYTIEEVVERFSGGLRSAMSYVGAANLDEFYKKSMFVIVSGSTQIENTPHFIYKHTQNSVPKVDVLNKTKLGIRNGH